MPKSSSADKTLEAALGALSRALNASKAHWMIIGGVAVIAHGVQRMTTDVDAVIEGGAIELRKLLRELRKASIVPRIQAAEAFAEANLVLLMRHVPSEVDLDLSLAWTRFEREALAQREFIAFGDVRAPMATVEALLVFKAIAGRSRDDDDVLALLNLHPGVDLADVRRRVAELAALADAPDIVDRFGALVAKATLAVSAATPAHKARQKRLPTRRADDTSPKPKPGRSRTVTPAKSGPRGPRSKTVGARQATSKRGSKR